MEESEPRQASLESAESDSAATPVEPYEKERIASIEARLDEHKLLLVGQEARGLQVFRNLTTAWKRRKTTTDHELGTALWALARYFLVARGPIVVLSIGGLLTALLALQANSLLQEQNRSIRVSTGVSAMEVNALESQRTATAAKSIPALAKRVHQSRSASTERPVDLPDDLLKEIQVLASSLSTYHTVDGWTIQHLGRRRDSWANRILTRAGLSRPDALMNSIPVPILSERPRGLEKGVLLSHLKGTNLLGKSLVWMDFSGASTTTKELDLRDTSISADFTNAFLPGVNFSRSNLNDSDFAGAVLGHATLHHIEAYQADFREAILRSAVFVQADLPYVDFRRADLTNVNFIEGFMAAHFEGANLTGAQFDQVEITGSCFSVETRLKELTIKGGVSFEKTCLQTGTRLPFPFDWSSYSMPETCDCEWMEGSGRPFRLESQTRITRFWESRVQP